MVAAHKYLAPLSDTIDYLVGIGSITHHVAQVPNCVVLRRGTQHGVQGLEVGVNIGKDEHTHG
jgi:hypothetical protein